MYCPQCGVQNDDNAFRCTACNRVIQQVSSAASAAPNDDAVMRMLLPIGRSWWSIAAGYAGLFAFLIFPAPLALVLGIIAINDLKKRPHLYGRGRAVFGTVVGALGTIVLAYLLIA